MGIKDYNSINKAAVEINRINVVIGVNGSGKSTASKILFSFLAANSKKRKDYIREILVEEVNRIIEDIEYDSDKKIMPESFSVYDDYDVIYEKYVKLLEIVEEYKNSLDNRKNALYEIIVNKFDEINRLLIEDGHPEENCFTVSMIDDVGKFLDLYGTIEKTNFKEIDKIADVFDDMQKLSYLEDDVKHVDFSIKLDTNHLMDLIFSEDEPNNNFRIMFLLLEKEFVKDAIDNFGFFIGKDKSQSRAFAFDYFFKKGFVENVFYVDSVSLLDLKHSTSSTPHMKDLFRSLDHLESEVNNSNTKLILEKIEGIIKGSYGQGFGNKLFTTEIEKHESELDHMINEHFKERFGKEIRNPKSKVKTFIHNTPSGIKQIGIIQILLKNNLLKEDSYLIIDEPEVNLHPDWQFKFAEILALISKFLNVTIYLNTHSPFFVEAIDAFTEFYDMQDETNYYLTEESENEGKYDFAKIPGDKLYKIYDNLGEAYKLIDQLRIRKRLDK